MAANKTIPTASSVDAFLDSVTPDKRRADALIVKAMMDRVTGWPATMWGQSMVGYGRYHYHYNSGRQGDYFVTGFAPRKRALSVYIMPGFSKFQGLLDRLGPHKTGVSCLYLGALDRIDMAVLEALVVQSIEAMGQMYPVHAT